MSEFNELMAATNGSASDITKRLSEYGGGNMGRGLIRLSKNRFAAGMVTCAVAIAGVGMITNFVVRPFRKMKKQQEVIEAYENGCNDGLLQATETVESSAERSGDL